MKTILYSVLLTTDAMNLIKDSLCEMFECEYQKSDTTRLLGIISEFNLALATRERIFLSTGSWLLVLRALRAKMIRNSGAVYNNLLHFQLLGVGSHICRYIEDVEGDLAFTFKVFRYFLSR